MVKQQNADRFPHGLPLFSHSLLQPREKLKKGKKLNVSFDDDNDDDDDDDGDDDDDDDDGDDDAQCKDR